MKRYKKECVCRHLVAPLPAGSRPGTSVRVHPASKRIAPSSSGMCVFRWLFTSLLGDITKLVLN